MSENQIDFKELLKHEDTVYGIMLLLLPLGLFSLIITYYNSTENIPDAFALHWLIPLLYFPVFYYVYNRKQFRVGRGQKNVKTLFERIGFEKTVIRQIFLAKIYKYSRIALLIIGVFGILGFQMILFAMDENITSYESQEKTYETELQKTIIMSEDELREYFKETILNEDNQVIEQWLIVFFMNKAKTQSEILDYQYDEQESRKDAEERIARLNDSKKREMMIPIMESLPYQEIKDRVEIRTEMLKPSNDPDNTEHFRSLELLVAIMMIPAMMAYVNFVFNPKRFEYFQYYFAMGAFMIVKNTTTTELQKRMYMKIGIDGYDHFLRDTLRMKINNLDTIKSGILIQNSTKLIEIGEKLEKLLADENQLQLAEWLKKDYITDENLPVLKTDSNQERIRNYFTFLVPTATTIIAVISLIVKF